MKLPFPNGGQFPAKLHWYWKSLMQVHCKKWIATSIYLLCAVSYCGFKPTFPHVLIFIVKSLIGNTKLVHTPNGLGDSAPSLYSAGVDWHSTVSPLVYKIELSADDIPLPGNIYPGAFTTLLYGNIKHLEKTASGETSHVVNDIAFQANFNGPECRQPIPENNKYKRRSTGPNTTNPACPQCWPQSWTIKNPTRDPKCSCKSFSIIGRFQGAGLRDICGVKCDCHRTSLWCNGGQKYNMALRQLKNVYQA